MSRRRILGSGVPILLTLALALAGSAPALAQQETAPESAAAPGPQAAADQQAAAERQGQMFELTKKKKRKKGKAQFWERLRLGATVNFMAGLEEIRSQSSNFIIFRDISIQISDVRFEPRVDVTGRITMSPVRTNGDLQYRVQNQFIRDPRQDFGVLQSTKIEDTLWLDLHGAWDFKTWRHGTLYGQLDLGYYKAEMNSIEVAIDLAEEAILNPVDQDLTADDPFANYQFIYPRVGTLTQIPASLSGLWQFRPRSPFRPYIGLGLGYNSLSMEDSSSLQTLNAGLAGINYSWTRRGEVVAAGDALPEETITVDVQSDYMWLAQGGLEYNINRKWSVFFSSVFMSTNARVQIRALGFQRFGQGIPKNDTIEDAEGITSEEILQARILSLPVEDAVALVNAIAEQSDIPQENQRTYYTSFPVVLGDEISIEIPNPTDPSGPTTVPRTTKLFVHGGDVPLDTFSVGVGFRYRY
jgi:outer membrane protein W